MKLTMFTKDHIAQQIATAAWKLGTSVDKMEAKRLDNLFRKMTTVSDALTSVGESFSEFRTIRDLTTATIQLTDDKLGADGELVITDSGVTYFQAINEVLVEARIVL